MSKPAMIALGGVVAGIILIPLTGLFPALAVLIAVPVAVYLLLDPETAQDHPEGNRPLIAALLTFLGVCRAIVGGRSTVRQGGSV
jgi:hypothetical protein